MGQPDDRLRVRPGRLNDHRRRGLLGHHVHPGGLWVHGPQPLQESHQLVGPNEDDGAELRGELRQGRGTVWRLVQS